jgi:ADP-ribose pyrophosphatase
VLVRHPESVAIVALDGDDLVAVRQTRPGAPVRTLELPSGKIEPGESPEQAVARELAEECGLAAQAWRELARFWAAPAYSTELVHVFEVTRLSVVSPSAPDEDEDISVERLPVSEAFARLDDAVSIAALALWHESR